MATTKFESLSKELISHVLGLEEHKENFTRSQEYVMSNLLYHHCLNVNGHQVQRRINGIILKLQVHGHHRMADRLTALMDKLKDASELDEEVDLRWSILSFLMEVSQNPMNNIDQVPISNTEDSTEQEDDSQPMHMTPSMWQSLLSDDLPAYVLGPEEPLSDWSSLSSSDDDDDLEVDSSSGCVSPVHSTLSPPKSLLNEAYLSKTQLDFLVQPSYWAKSVIDINPSHPAACLPYHMTCSDIPVKEWNVMREIIWLLVRPSPGYIFTRGNDGYIKLSSDTSISSLSQICLSNLLKRVESMAAKLEELDAWTAQAECSSENILAPTLRSYANGLHLWRCELIEQLVQLETQVRNKDCSSLNWLLKNLQPMMNNVDLVARIHSKAFNCTDKSQPFKLLSVLVCSIDASTNITQRSILLRLFLHSLRYYIHLISLWLHQSTTPPNSSHFILYRNTEVTSEDPQFWINAFTDKVPGRKTTLKDDLSLPGLEFLRCIRGPLAEIGKVRELLEIHFKGSEYKHIGSEENDVEEMLITQVAEVVGTTLLDQDDTDYLASADIKKSKSNLPDSVVCDPYLMEAFKDTKPARDHNSDKCTKLIEKITARNSIKIEKVVSDVLLPIVRNQQSRLGKELSDVLLDKYHLRDHMIITRSVYLLEAGDVMNDFFSYLLTKISSADAIDVVDLTLYLQYCIGRISPDLAQNFSVTIDKDNNEDGKQPSENMKSKQETIISSLTVHYKAPWPIYIVLNDQVIKQYNKLLQLCFSMKQAICLLQRLNFRELTSMSNNEAAMSDINAKHSEPTSLPWRLHRLQLLRQWLLYFSNVVHDHFATTALMPFQHNVENLLDKKLNLGVLLFEHDKLLKDVCRKCLLPEDNKQSPVQDIFVHVFGVVEEVARLWTGPHCNVTPEHLTKLEENYANYHRFLVNLLAAITRSQFNPHLEALTLALVNSCPLNV